jgi:hypothetical protein
MRLSSSVPFDDSALNNLRDKWTWSQVMCVVIDR